MDAAFRRNAGGVTGGAINPLHRLGIDRRRSGGVGEQPATRSADLPPEAQAIEQARRQQRVTILIAFALAYLETHPIRGALDVRDLQGADFGDAQAGGVGRHQERASAQGSGGSNQACHFFVRKDLRQTFGHFGHGDIEARVRTFEYALKEKAKGAGRLVDTGVGQLLLGDEVQQVLLNLRGVELVGRAPVIPGQTLHTQ